MLRLWRTFTHLTNEEKKIVGRAILLLLLLKVALAIFGFRRVYTILKRLSDGYPLSMATATPEDIAQQAHRIAYLIQASSAYLFVKTTCLHRALTLWYLLRKNGFSAQFKIGVNTQSLTIKQFEAHAWVEVNGVSLDVGQDMALFAELPNLPEF